MKKIIFVLLLVASLFLTSYRPALAHCPLCVAGAGAGLTLSRLLGIDDSITGLWIGALLGAMSFWGETFVLRYLKVKKYLFRPLLYLSIFGLTILSFYQFKLVNTMSDMFGIHKLTFGIIVGGVMFYFVDLVDDLIIRSNRKVFFPYQRIVVNLGFILFASVADYWLINYII